MSMSAASAPPFPAGGQKDPGEAQEAVSLRQRDPGLLSLACFRSTCVVLSEGLTGRGKTGPSCSQNYP